MHKTFRIGDFVFRLSFSEIFPIPEHFLRFEIPEEKPVFSYDIHFAEKLPVLNGTPVVQRDDLIVLEQNGLQTRYIGIKGEGFYGCCREKGNGSAEIVLVKEVLPILSENPVFTALFALDRRLLKENGLVLHCAYLRYQDEAILFSAPSGTGKSTQAGLWETFRGAKTINGDRTLLEYRSGQWYARGWPVCGSSNICENIDTPVRAIIMLSQAESNTMKRLRPIRAITELFPQMLVNRWDPDAVQTAMDLTEKLILQVPVWHLDCTISEEAVLCVEEALCLRKIGS